MDIKLSKRGNALIAKFYGELDDHTVEYARQKIENEMIKPAVKNIILDFSNLTFMDSSGIGMIMGRYKKMEKISGKVAIACSNPQIIRLLNISGISSVIPLHPDINSAVKTLRGE
ncbi:MAG: anti-sigma factor antagonist [Clostridiaceae bacterium]|nr:anti-sigma factor antagonist [Clostridiaceae bacterium]